MKRTFKRLAWTLVLSALLFQGIWLTDSMPEASAKEAVTAEASVSSMPAFDGVTPAIPVNGNLPMFTDAEKKRTDGFEVYSEMDALGRCGVAYANICKELMPTQERGNIGMVKPSGWHTVKYPEVIADRYLYNRCHLIGYQLAGENANTKNLITGTRFLNVEGMLPYENLVADYVQRTGNHVLYRATPVFAGTNLVAGGVQLEAWSVEDAGAGICFNVYCYNSQPGVEINYATGDSALTGTQTISAAENKSAVKEVATEAVSDMVWLSATGKKYHSVNDCGNMNPNKARQVTEAEAVNMGKGKCSKCW